MRQAWYLFHQLQQHRLFLNAELYRVEIILQRSTINPQHGEEPKIWSRIAVHRALI